MIQVATLSAALLNFSVILSGQASANTRIQKTFDQWSVNCIETDKKRCSLNFGLVNAKNKRLVLGWTVVPAREGEGNTAIIRTPIGMLLPNAITVKFPESEPVTIGFRTCNRANCMGEVPFSDAWVKAFRAGTSFTISYQTANGKEFKHEVSLKSFSEAFAFYTEQLQ